MKLYILTSTLNFHSIMATESCSPSAYYSHRNFGDSYFYVAGSFAKNNSIILFNKYPKCKMPQTEEEQYSLVIEIDTEKTAHFEYEEIDINNDIVIYQTGKTIYLNPIGCKFMFESETIRDLIVSRAKVRSLDAKMLFYSKAGCFSVPCDNSFSYRKEYVEPYHDIEFDEENLSRDKKINKCKGFLYGYLLGTNTSPGEGVSSLRQILKELSNLIHARITNQDFNLHTDKIIALQNLFISKAQKYDIVSQKLSESAKRLNGSSIEMLQKELENLGLWNSFAHRMFSIPDLSLIYTSVEWNSIEDDIEKFINNIMSNSKQNILVDEIPSIHNFQPAIIPLKANNQEIQIYTEWIKVLLNSECNLKDFFVNKLSYLKRLGIIAKEIIGEESFTTSSERTFYNGLIKNIREAEEFEIISFDSIIWQSLAVCAKTTNPNIEALYSLMTSCAIKDYRCAVAIWGALCGYADMPKTFFNRIAEGVTIAEAYEYVNCINKRVIGFESEGIKIPNIQVSREDVTNMYPDCSTENSLKKIVYKYIKEYELETKKKLQRSNRDSIDKALSLTSDGKILSFLMTLNDFSGFKRKNKTSFWSYLKNKACPEYEEVTTTKVSKKSSKKNTKSPMLFDMGNETIKEIKSKDFNASESFVFDRNCWNSLKNIISPSLHHDFYSDLKWFQDEYAKGEHSKYYAHASRKNCTAIEAFIRYIRKRDYAKALNTKQISEYLHKKYV